MRKVLSVAFLLMMSLAFVVEGAQSMNESSKPSGASSSSAKPPVEFHEVPFGEPVNPDRCKNSKGKKGYLYWAARDQVFAFRFNPGIPVYPRIGNPHMMRDEFIPPAPNPNEPEGCYGNPLRGGSVPYMWDYSATIHQKLMGRPLFVAQYGHTHHQQAIQDERLLRDDHNEFNKKQFAKGKDCRMRATGITECIISRRPKEYSTQLLEIKSELLFSNQVKGRDIYVAIVADIPSQLSLEKAGKVLESAIELYGAVRINDSFRIHPHEIDLLIPYYQSMISYLVDARVADYSWNSDKTQK